MNRIRQLRLAHGMKQIELAGILGISQGTLSGWENGKYDPDLESLNALASVFKVSLDHLLGQNGSTARNDSIKEDEDLWELREQLRRSPEMRVLFDVSKNATPEDLRKAVKIIKTLKGEDSDD